MQQSDPLNPIDRFLTWCVGWFHGRALLCVLLVDFTILAGCFSALHARNQQDAARPLKFSELFLSATVIPLIIMLLTALLGILVGMVFWLRTGGARVGVAGEARSARQLLVKSAAAGPTITIAGGVAIVMWEFLK